VSISAFFSPPSFRRSGIRSLLDASLQIPPESEMPDRVSGPRMFSSVCGKQAAWETEHSLCCLLFAVALVVHCLAPVSAI
jgi:hypothetical protein